MANRLKVLRRQDRHISQKELNPEIKLLNQCFKEVTGIEIKEALKSKKPQMYALRSLYYHELYYNFPLCTNTIAVLTKKDKDGVSRAIKSFEQLGDKHLLHRLRAEFYYERALFYEKKLKKNGRI